MGMVIIDAASKGDYDILIVSHRPDQSINWFQTAGSALPPEKNDADFAKALTLDLEGNIYVSGRFHHEADFDDDGIPDVIATVPDTASSFLAMYKPDGSFAWVHAFGDSTETATQIHYSSIENTLYATGASTSGCRRGILCHLQTPYADQIMPAICRDCATH